ncbi:hypothetical protein C5167_008054 [Papaver somniferum]|uniref:Polysaccharide biosynthesis protein C-terminal domain-containing protein n=1 Tax=Papaver somniferum TaxID=3469 RepID=A0A4Y7JUW6_PAPSO|nr:hypothetical protein C5167_008054 [Papaver somniferum]
MEIGVVTNGGREEIMRPLLEGNNGYHSQNENDLARRVWIESKKLWHIAGSGIFSRISGFSITIITIAFAGNLGNLELASISIAILGILMLMTGKLNNVKIAVSALAVCMKINSWEMMIPLAFFAATGVRVANELGAGNGKAAKFSSIVSATTSMIIGLCICTMITIFHEKLSFLLTSSDVVIQAVDKLTFLLGITILLNSIQPILSGVAVGSGWQASVAYINIGCYYVIGLPLGVTLGWVFHLGVGGIWSGMIGGTAVQTLILIIMTMRCGWDLQAEKASSRMRMLATPSSKA